jgi:carboxyl-terminal processing protease
LDEHSFYFLFEDYEQFKERTDSWTVGVGVQVNQEKVITEIIPEGPASMAGLMVGDQLSKINGVSLEDWNLGHIRAAFKQDIGTSISVEVMRSFSPFATTLVVDEIPLINYSIIPVEPDLIYVSIKRFSGGISAQIIADLQAANAASKNGLKGVILDLRNNPGGNVNDGI